MRRGAAIIATAAAALACTPPPAAAYRADGQLSEWRGTASGVAGRTVVSRGEVVYTDFLYDDYGPDLDQGLNLPPARGAGALTSGDYRYPGDDARYGRNAADLRELRLRVTPRGLFALIALQTMKAPDATIATIAIDADERSAGEWPDGAGIVTPGPERFITTWGTGGRLTTPEGSVPVRTAVNLEQNAIEVQVSRKALGTLGPRFRLWAVSGLHDGEGAFGVLRPGQTAVFNAAFRSGERFDPFQSGWGEQAQGDALASRDVTPFSYGVSTRRLERGRSDRPRPLAPGTYERVFRSSQKFGEGIDSKDVGSVPLGCRTIGGSAPPQYLSPHQPYILHVPEGHDPSRPAPLTLVGHSLDTNHAEYASFMPHLLLELGDDRGSLLLTPLARGNDTWYLDAGLADVLEAWEDVRRHHRLDEERTSITGYSMGGYMTYRLGLLMPDRFARASVYVGPPAYCFWPYPAPLQTSDEWRVRSNTNLLVENALNLPYEIVHGNLDEVVPVTGVQFQADTFRRHGNAFRFYRHSADDHLTFATADRWGRTREFLGAPAHARERDPLEVRFRYLPAVDLRHRTVEFEGRPFTLVFDDAYWVRDVSARAAAAETDSALVEAITFARGGRRRAVRDLGVSAVDGPSTPGTLTGQERAPSGDIERRNAFQARLENVRRLAFDTARMGLDTRVPLEALITTDGEVTVVLRGRFAAVAASVPARRTSRSLRFTLPAGEHVVRVSPRAGG